MQSIYELMSQPVFTLASASQRRRDLLNQLGLAYRIFPAEIDETPYVSEDPCDYVRRMAMSKAATVWKQFSDLPVLAADTICLLDNEILGKPGSLSAARGMLEKLSGRIHTVITAVSIYNHKHQQQISKSQVYFRSLSNFEIECYCQTQEPMGKAGSYAIQGYAAAIIKTITGSYSGIVGLPLFETAELLSQIGISVIPVKSQ